MTFIILTIAFLVIALGLAGFTIYRSVTLVRTPMIEIDYKGFLKKSAYFLAGGIASFVAASFFFIFRHGDSVDFLHAFQLALGGILLFGCLFTAINVFIIHYYGRNIPEKIDKWFFRTILVGFTASVFFFFIYTNGLAPYLSYPLKNGISFKEGLVTPHSANKPNIAFYALCILSGAILVYFICDHIFYKEYGKHGILESTFFVAFPAGIIGARIAYVIGEWNSTTNGRHSFAERVANGEWWAPLAIWEGGITILGGAIGGILIGALWYKWRNRDKNLFLAADLIVPAILIAQAVGRWGNFFNCEVHGLAVDEAAWKWLPEIIFNNAHHSDSGASLVGQIYVPLFFIEAIINLLGYFVIAHVFGKALRKYTELGDLACGYIIWYGLTRLFLEPLRAPSYQMGEKGFWSWTWSMVFVVIGTLLIVINHIVCYVLKRKKGQETAKPNDKLIGIISALVFAVIGGVLLGVAINLLANNSLVLKPEYNMYNVGLMLLVVGISVLLCLGISAIKIIDGFKKPQVANE